MSNPTLLTDYLFMGALIEDRLRAELGDQVPVEGIETMSQARDEADLRARVAYVMWGGDRFDVGAGGSSGGGVSQKVLQRWVVWLRVRNASQANKGARNDSAGALLSSIHKALAGWKAEGAFRPLLRTQGPAPDYQAVSGLYPLAFEINLAL